MTIEERTKLMQQTYDAIGVTRALGELLHTPRVSAGGVYWGMVNAGFDVDGYSDLLDAVGTVNAAVTLLRRELEGLQGELQEQLEALKEAELAPCETIPTEAVAN